MTFQHHAKRKTEDTLKLHICNSVHFQYIPYTGTYINYKTDLNFEPLTL